MGPSSRNLAVEASVTQKDTYCLIPLPWGSWNSHNHKDKVDWWLPGAGRGKGASVEWVQSFVRDDAVLGMDGGDVAQQRGCT